MAEAIGWLELKAIVDAALQLPESERVPFVAEACVNDDDLRVAVEALLAISTRGFTLHQLGLRTHDEPRLLPPGALVDDFRVIELIGQGGMATVYLAHDEKRDRRVALKALHTSAEYNRGEDKLLAKLSHPAIATLYTSGETTDGFRYLAMEYVDGLPLDQYCERTRPTLKQRLILFQQIADGVRYAHEHLVVHRDLTPRNILVTAQGKPKIIDLGIAKELSELPLGLPDGEPRAMTVYFASPEQRKGEPTGPTTDVYSLGVLLSALLTGRHPYRLSILLARPEEISPPSQPSTFINDEERPRLLSAPPGDPARLARMIRGDLDAIIVKALDPDPTDRYQTVAELTEDVGRHLAVRPVSARRPSHRYRAAKFFRRRALLAGLSAMVAAALLVLGLSALGQYRRALRGEREASAQADRARAINRFMVDLLRGTGPFNDQGSTNATVDELLEQASTLSAGSLDPYPDLKAEVLSTIGAILSDRGSSEKGKALLQKALAIQRRGSRDLALAETLHRLGGALTALGKYRESDAALAEAASVVAASPSAEPVLTSQILVARAVNRIREADYAAARELTQASLDALQDSPANYPQLSTALHGIGRVLTDQDQDAEAERVLRQALVYAERIPNPRNAYAASIQSSLAALLDRLGRYDEARKRYLSALDIQGAMQGEDSVAFARTLHNLATLDNREGKYLAARDKFTQVVAIYERQLPPGNTHLLTTQNQLAATLVRLHEYEEAERIFLAVLAAERAQHPTPHPKVGVAVNNLAFLYQEQGRFAEAEAHYQEALRIYREVFGPESREVATLLGNLGSLARDRDNLSTSKRHFEEALAIARHIGDGRSPITVASLVNLAAVRLATGDVDSAANLVHEGVEIAEALTGPSSLLTGITYSMHARVLLAQGKAPQALTKARQARGILAAALPPGDSRVASIDSVVGAALGMTGHSEEAESILLRSLAELRRLKGSHSVATREASARVRAFYRSTGRSAGAEKFR